MSVYGKQQQKKHFRLGIPLFVLGVCLAVIAIYLQLRFGMIGVLVSLAALWLIMRSKSLLVTGIDFFQGDKGEAKVIKALQDIPAITVYNDVHLANDAGNIDHVVVTPNRVFVLETKSYTGRLGTDKDGWYFWRGGKQVRVGNFTKQANGNALRLKSYLKHQIPNLPEAMYINVIVVLVRGFDSDYVHVKNVMDLKDLREFFMAAQHYQPVSYRTELAKAMAQVTPA